MSARLKHLLWALLGAALAGAVAVLVIGDWIGSKAHDTEVPASPAPPVARTDASAPREAPSPQTRNGSTGAQSPGQPLDAAALGHLCGRPWMAAFTADCLAALEHRFRDTVPDRKRSPRMYRPVLLGEPVTWGEVFDDVPGALAAVRAAVARPECLVPEGRFRLDLGRECAADDMARLAILRRACVQLLFADGLDARQRRWDRAVADIRDAVDVDQADYHQRIDRLHEDWFGMMWRWHKCRALPEGALRELGPFARPFGWPRTVIEFDMIEAAARLGSDWALSSVLHMGATLLETSDEGMEDVRGRPVLAELLRMRRAEGVERLKHAVVAFQLGEAMGVQVHPDGVFRFTGLFTRDDHRAAWRQAAPRLIALGWTLVVDDPAAGAPRRIEKAEDLWGDEPWLRWEEEGRIRLVAAG